MSNTNLKLLDASQVPEKLRKTLTETVGYNKPSGNRYKRVATSSRSDGTKYKTESRNKLQVHTHNFINKANQVDGNYAALSLAKQLKSRLQSLGFDGWVYPDESYATRAGQTPTETNILSFHPEMLIWNVGKITVSQAP